MKHAYREYLKLLDNFINEEKINEINIMIKKNQADMFIGNTRDNRYDRIKQLKQIKNSISL